MSDIQRVNELAQQFLELSHDDFRFFWAVVQMEWNDEEIGADIEAQWFEFGRDMRGNITVISAMLSALRSGEKAGKRK